MMRDPDIIGIFVAWPYANGDLHLGHIAGAYLPPDIFARYNRLRGNKVLMVSGSDSHGTPITVKAHKEGLTPRAVFEHYHRRFLKGWIDLGISFDLFTHTDTENHHSVAQDIFEKLYSQNDIVIAMETLLYDEKQEMFLPDRYVEGTCPFCDFGGARGDQCDSCGRTLDAVELKNPRSILSDTTPILKETQQFFFDLPAYNEELLVYVRNQKHWRLTVSNYVMSWLSDGLVRRPISRDIDWGIPIPVAGWEKKVMYVWFEAVMGYLTASREWATNNGVSDAWKEWWHNDKARGYYFIGKDNVPFHAIIWPAILLAYDRGLNLPYDIPANQYLNFKGDQFSKSRGAGILLMDFLKDYEPDPLRYYLAAVSPETKDTSFTWEGFVTHNNTELVAAWGNLVNRVLTFAQSRFEARIPEPHALESVDIQLLKRIEDGFKKIGKLYGGVKLRDALESAMDLVHEANRYFDFKEPWKKDRTDSATTLFISILAVDSLKVLLAPVLPHSSQKIHESLGYEQSLFGRLRIESFREKTSTHQALTYLPTNPELSCVDRWVPSSLEPGTPIKKLSPLFKILEHTVDDAEVEKP